MTRNGIYRAIDGGIAILRLDRPGAKNALTRAMIEEIDDLLTAWAGDPEVRVLLLGGSENFFGAGADIGELSGLDGDGARREDYSGSVPALGNFPKPVVAAVAGYAFGGALELVEMADIVVAGENARFAHPEIGLAAMPGAGGSVRLPLAVGKAKALDLLMTGRTMKADEAERAGLVSRIVADGKEWSEALSVARKLADLSAPVLAMIKRSVAAAVAPSRFDLRQERDFFHRSLDLADHREGTDAFLGKRGARFAHR